GALNGLQRLLMLIAAALTLLPPVITVGGVDGWICNIIGVVLGVLLLWGRIRPGARSEDEVNKARGDAGSNTNAQAKPVGAD
ncbi:MAG: hypothetical protein WBD13_00495, partial [Burkholderiaceae bacterium]